MLKITKILILLNRQFFLKALKITFKTVLNDGGNFQQSQQKTCNSQQYQVFISLLPLLFKIALMAETFYLEEKKIQFRRLQIKLLHLQSFLTMQKPELELSQIQQKLAESLYNFQKMHISTINQSQTLYQNVSKILPLFIKAAQDNMKSFVVLLRFLTDKEIMTIGLTCKSFYKLIYSPLGYRIMNTSRPIIIKVQKKKQGPIITKKQIENLTSDKSLVNMDDDDKQAIIITMQSNLIATKQKVSELEELIINYDKNSDAIIQQISFIGGMRDEEMQKKDNIKEEIEKLEELMKESEKNVIMLKEEQEKMLHERNIRLVVLQAQKSKLEHHKDLLIKKVKSQQKEKEEGMMHAREVNRILEKLNKIIGPKKS